MGMRRGGCARRAMLGAVAAGALLGAARGTYTIDLDNQEAGGGDVDDRTDDEYKVKTTAGLEIVIGPSAGSVYDIAPALPNPDNGLLLSIAVEGGDNQVPDVAGSCPGGIALDASNGNIFCYGVQRDAVPLVTNIGGSLTMANAGNNVAERTAFDTWWGASFAGVDIDFDVSKCPGDIDFDVINGVITCYAVALGGGRGAAVVENTGGTVTVTATPGVAETPGETPTALECLGGIVFDQENDKLFCYPKSNGVRDVENVAESDAFDANSGSINVSVSGTNKPTDGFFAICPGDIDLAINGDITCFQDEAGGSGTALVKNTGSGSITVTGGTNTPDETITPSSCPGGITLDKSEDPLEIFCYNVARIPVPLETNVAVNGDSGSIVVTETSEENVASQEKTTIAGGTINSSATITVTGGDALESEGTNYKIELNTDNGAFTETVTVDDGEAPTNPLITETETKLDGTVTKTVTKPDGTVTETVEVTASSSTATVIAELFDAIAALEDTIPLPFADGTVIEIESKGADSGDLKVEVVTTELATTVTEYNIDYSTDEAGILGFIKEIKTEEESVTTTFFLTGDDSLPNPNGEGVNATVGDYLDLFEEELSSSLTVATYRNRLPAGGKLPESFKDGETGEIKGEAILKFEIEGTSYITLFDDPSRLALTANLTTQVSDGTSSRKLLQQGVVAETETEFRSQIDGDDNIEESLKEVEKDANGNVIRFSAKETKIEVGETGVVTVTGIETVNGGTADPVVTVNELVLTSIGGTKISEKTTVNDKNTFCDPPFAIVCGGSGSAPAPSPDNGGGGGGGPAPVPSPDNGGGGGGG